MAEHVIVPPRMRIDSFVQEDVKISFGLFKNKYMAAREKAAELLNAANMTPNIYDSLNCGKFNRKFVKFFNELMAGSFR